MIGVIRSDGWWRFACGDVLTLPKYQKGQFHTNALFCFSLHPPRYNLHFLNYLIFLKACLLSTDTPWLIWLLKCTECVDMKGHHMFWMHDNVISPPLKECYLLPQMNCALFRNRWCNVEVDRRGCVNGFRRKLLLSQLTAEPEHLLNTKPTHSVCSSLFFSPFNTFRASSNWLPGSSF